jgi:chromosome segregation ATPase
MGIERIVTDEAVFEAADRLADDGEKPTNRAIWNAIGGGSMTTISQALRRWRERQELQIEPQVERVPLPAAVADVLHDAAAKLWQAAMDETKAELEQLAQATNARVAEAQAERDEALAELQTTAEELEQAKVEVGRQAEQLAAGADEMEQLRVTVQQYADATDAATHRADTAEAARAELQARVEQLTALLEREQAAHAKAEAEAKVNGELSAELRAKLDASERRAAEIEARATTSEQAAEQARREAETARIAEQAGQARLESAAREIEVLRADKAAAEDRYRKAADSAARWQGRLEALSAGKTPIQANAGDVDESVLKWLTGTPDGDVNFKSELNRANAATLRAALECETLTKAARKAIESALNKLG